jgi:hypothetical protein
MSQIKTKALEFLYKWTQEAKVPHIKKGMAEDLEAFVLCFLSEAQAHQTANRVANTLEETKDETNS